MSRQVNIDLSDTINSWRQKSNLTATYLGDLDNLAGGISADSNIVAALNTMYNIRRSYTAGNGIAKNTPGDSTGQFSVSAGHGLTQEAGGLMLEDMPANTIKVRDAGTAGASSNKAVTDEQILIGDGTGFTSAALSQDVLMTNNGVVTIQPDVVTYDKMQDIVTANRVLGKTSAGTVEEVQIQTDMISDDQVTNDKLDNMPANTVKVNATGGTAGPTNLVIGADRVLGRDSIGNLSSLQVTAGMLAPGAAVPDQIGHNGKVLGTDGTSSTANWVYVDSDTITNDAIITSKIRNLAVIQEKIADDAIIRRTISPNAVGSSELDETHTYIALDFMITSDERLKSNIQTIDNGLDKVINMRGVSFDIGGSHKIGVIAQEMEQIVPEVVTTGEDDFKTVSYGSLVGVLIEAIKDLNAKIKKLENQ
jgi:hypothetical protein